MCEALLKRRRKKKNLASSRKANKNHPKNFLLTLFYSQMMFEINCADLGDKLNSLRWHYKIQFFENNFAKSKLIEKSLEIYSKKCIKLPLFGCDLSHYRRNLMTNLCKFCDLIKCNFLIYKHTPPLTALMHSS